MAFSNNVCTANSMIVWDISENAWQSWPCFWSNIMSSYQRQVGPASGRPGVQHFTCKVRPVITLTCAGCNTGIKDDRWFNLLLLSQPPIPHSFYVTLEQIWRHDDQLRHDAAANIKQFFLPSSYAPCSHLERADWRPRTKAQYSDNFTIYQGTTQPTYRVK